MDIGWYPIDNDWRLFYPCFSNIPEYNELVITLFWFNYCVIVVAWSTVWTAKFRTPLFLSAKQRVCNDAKKRIDQQKMSWFFIFFASSWNAIVSTKINVFLYHFHWFMSNFNCYLQRYYYNVQNGSEIVDL